jgi:hypothetical protein
MPDITNPRHRFFPGDEVMIKPHRACKDSFGTSVETIGVVMVVRAILTPPYVWYHVNHQVRPVDHWGEAKLRGDWFSERFLKAGPTGLKGRRKRLRRADGDLLPSVGSDVYVKPYSPGKPLYRVCELSLDSGQSVFVTSAALRILQARSVHLRALVVTSKKYSESIEYIRLVVSAAAEIAATYRWSPMAMSDLQFAGAEKRWLGTRDGGTRSSSS